MFNDDKIEDVLTDNEQSIEKEEEIEQRIMEFYREFSSTYVNSQDRACLMLSLSVILFGVSANKLASSSDGMKMVNQIESGLLSLISELSHQDKNQIPDLVSDVRYNVRTVQLLKMLLMDVEALEKSSGVVNPIDKTIKYN